MDPIRVVVTGAAARLVINCFLELQVEKYLVLSSQ